MKDAYTMMTLNHTNLRFRFHPELDMSTFEERDLKASRHPDHISPWRGMLMPLQPIVVPLANTGSQTPDTLAA